MKLVMTATAGELYTLAEVLRAMKTGGKIALDSEAVSREILKHLKIKGTSAGYGSSDSSGRESSWFDDNDSSGKE